MSIMDKKEIHRVWKRKWRKDNYEHYRSVANEYMRNYHKTPKGRAIMRASSQKTRQKRREFLLSFFGGKCCKCGFSDVRALHMDHRLGRNGEKRLGNIDSRYSFVKNNPEEALRQYQLLCANCNFIKVYENNEFRPRKTLV